MAEPAQPQYCDVAIPHTRLAELTYQYDPAVLPNLDAGDCVLVRLRNKRVRAIVIGRGSRPAVSRILSVEQLLWPQLVPAELIRLALRVNSYYFGHIGTTLGLILPRGIVTTSKKLPAIESQPSTFGLPSFAQTTTTNGHVVLFSGSSDPNPIVANYVASALAGGSVIVLSPETDLGNWQRELERMASSSVVPYHAGLSLRQRRQVWFELRCSSRRIVLGTRSAVFAPVPDLRGIVVLNEHDRHYKEERYPRFHARDVAILRAQAAGCSTLLCDTVPSLETWYHVKNGSYRQLHGPSLAPADLRVIDMRRHYREILAPLARHELQKTMARGQSAVVYVNRRGLARYVACTECATPLVCPQCQVNATLQSGGELCCPWCGHRSPAPDQCQVCGGLQFEFRSPGLEGVEREIRKLPTSSRIALVEAGRTPPTVSNNTILIGTAALFGMGWPEDTALVLAPVLDGELCRPDFRAAETAFSVVAALMSRAATHNAKLLIQTRRPDDPVVEYASNGNVVGFLDAELAARKELGYAPISRIAIVELTGKTEAIVARHAATIARRLEREQGVTVLGPVSVRGRQNRLRLLVKLTRPQRLDRLIALKELERPGVSVRVDVDPLWG